MLGCSVGSLWDKVERRSWTDEKSKENVLSSIRTWGCFACLFPETFTKTVILHVIPLVAFHYPHFFPVDYSTSFLKGDWKEYILLMDGHWESTDLHSALPHGPGPHDNNKRVKIFKSMKGNAFLTWHITSSWNSLLGDIVAAHTSVRFKFLKNYQCSRSRTWTLGLAGVTETYFPHAIMLHSLPVANGGLSSPLKYELVEKIARLVHDWL